MQVSHLFEKLTSSTILNSQRNIFLVSSIFGFAYRAELRSETRERFWLFREPIQGQSPRRGSRMAERKIYASSWTSYILFFYKKKEWKKKILFSKNGNFYLNNMILSRNTRKRRFDLNPINVVQISMLLLHNWKYDYFYIDIYSFYNKEGCRI